MKRVVVEGVRAEDVAHAVGEETFARGREYARRGAVLHTVWVDEEQLVEALVAGSGRRSYATMVYFEADGLGGLELVHGECACPMGFMCKHVAAVALAVAPDGDRPGAGAALAPPRWEGALEALLPRGGPAAPTAAPLAVELSPAGDATGGLAARLLRPGKRGWIAGGLTWNRLDEMRQGHELRRDHVALARELHALHQAGGGASRPSYYAWSYGDQKTIDLSGLGSRRFWAWLDDAVDAGLALLGPGHSRLAEHRRGSMVLDVTADAETGAIAVAPVLVLEGHEHPESGVRPVAFVGDHGVVHTAADPAGSAGSLLLTRLDPPVAPEVARAALSGARVSVPADQAASFRSRFGPRLRAAVSSDASFRPPEVSAPTAVLRLAYGEPHDLRVGWEWAYTVDGVESRVPDTGGGADGPPRDRAAEQAILDAVRELPVDWGRYGLLTGRPGPATPWAARLSGLDTVAFTTEAVPVLDGAAVLRLERSGAAPEYREVGDSLRIGLSTSESESGTDWFDLGIDISVEGRPVPFAEVFTALAAGDSYLLRPDGAYFSLEKPELVALRTLIEEARALQDGPPGPLRLTRFQAGWWEELAALGVVERQAGAWREQVGGLLAAGALDPPPVPATLRAQLRPYQREGFEWLAFLWRHRLGGILADDMGLGKTVQALAMLCHAREAQPDGGPFLIVAPTSVVANWTREAARFAPHLAVVALTDTLARRREDLATAIAGADVVVTSYTLFRLDIDPHETVGWAGAVFDEAQFLKNRQSKVHACARRVPAPVKLAITGTPMENDLSELWALLSITAPGLFPSPQRFRDTFARPIEKGGDAELLARLRRRVRPLILRRTKEHVSPELPPKQQQVLAVELSPAHRTLYQRHLQRERQKILGLLDDIDGNRFTILASITLLRRLALHAALVEETSEVASAKIDALVAQLGDIAATGHRALVFSQFTGFLAHVRDALDAAGIAYAYLDGTTRSRDAVVTRFKEGDAPVFLISLKAGGFGLNLTEADYCFLLDPWWNPATEAQAIDRTHRIGQERPVMVYRLIARDTIEEKVRALAERKAELVSGVMDDGAAFGSALTAADIRALVS